MSRTLNLAAQQHLGELVNAGEIDRLGEVFAPDVVDHDPAPDQGPGLEGLQEFFTALKSAFADAHLEVDTIVADDEQVAVAYRLTGTHTGEFLGIPATERAIDTRGVQIARFADGRIVERWGSSDQLGILSRLGAEVATAR